MRLAAHVIHHVAVHALVMQCPACCTSVVLCSSLLNANELIVSTHAPSAQVPACAVIAY